MIADEVGKRIRLRRKAISLSQEKLALKADIDRSYLASVELGRRNISIINLQKIVHALEISLEEFFEGI